jgi:hypothetical protein
MKEYLEGNPLNDEKCEKYGLISHSTIIASLTAKGVDPETGLLVDFIWFKNCEMRPFHNF